MDTKINLCGKTQAELAKFASDLNFKPFHGRQIYKWIYSNLLFDFGQMTDLKKDFRAELDLKAEVILPPIADQVLSSDGTEKFLFKVGKKEYIESVLIFDDSSGRTTLCISSQVGCPLDCSFCATGQMGYKRNLNVGEIIGQVMAIRTMYGPDKFENIVFMGMGEPFLNYDNVMAAIEIMIDPKGMKIAAKRITISTVGIEPGIVKLTESGSKVNLALSLHYPDDKRRRIYMPIAKSFGLKKTLAAVKAWTKARNRRVTLEYILFDGINDSYDDALRLARLVKGIPCKINLLAYNPVKGVDFKRPSEDKIDRFARVLFPRTPAVTVRKSRGKDVAAACGQLAGKKGYSV